MGREIESRTGRIRELKRPGAVHEKAGWREGDSGGGSKGSSKGSGGVKRSERQGGTSCVRLWSKLRCQ